MKDRLIELLDECRGIDGMGRELLEKQADHLLANGVIVPPCEVGTHLWKIIYPYGQEPKVTEFVVKQTVAKRNEIQIEIQSVDVPTKIWMCSATFYTTKAEAEKALAERRENNG